MRIIILIFICILFFSCQKEVSPGNNQIISNTFDSLVGNWKYIYDYRLVTTQSNLDVVIDSVYSGNYQPFSYFKINADTTYRFYITASQILPTRGYGMSGEWIMNDSLRGMKLITRRETHDDFGPLTWDVNPPQTGPLYKIKYLSNDSMVLYFRVIAQGSPNHYWWWHDVFVK